MGRYANNGQEVLERNGKLVGFNAGYGYYSEHESHYLGLEQRKQKKLIDKNKNNPFNGEIVENPNAIKMMEFSDGNVWITNDSWDYYSLMNKTEEERNEIKKNYVHNEDRRRLERDSLAYAEEMIDAPEIIALWSAGHNGDGNFDLISTTEKSSEVLRKLYEEMQKGNVAISSDYSFMFKDRGLSFVLLDQLTQNDLTNKQLVDHQEELAEKFEKEYNQYLIDEGLEGLFGGNKYPIEFWNVQIQNLLQGRNGEVVPEFYLEITDTSKGREDLDASTIPNISSYMTGPEIKFLVPIVQTQEYAEFAKAHSKEEIGEYLNSKLEEYHKQQRISQEQEYQIGEDSLESIAREQRTENVERKSSSLCGKIANWLNPDRENDKNKSDGRGE